MRFTEVSIQYVQGIGPHRAAILAKQLNIHTVGDLIQYYPYKHIDRSRLYRISEIDGTMPFIQLKGEILTYDEVGAGRKQRLVATFYDGTGTIELVWFQGIRYVRSHYKPHVQYLLFGRPAMYGNRISIAHPDLDSISNDPTHDKMGLMPAYSTTELMKRSGITSEAMRKYITSALASIKERIAETLPEWLTSKHQLMPLDEAIRAIHLPQSLEQLRKAEYRLKFEELFYIQLQLLRYSKQRSQTYRGFMMPRVGTAFNTFFHNHLPFPLTGAQKRVIKEIHTDVCSGKQMNRLLQGDVGSGKTIVALMTMLLAIDNGFQACLIAPTEILASQHYETISYMLSDMPLRIELLTGSIKGKRREATLTATSAGEVHILIGTHAVLEESVVFSSLGMVIIDEQHRFGVEQRARMWNKTANMSSNTPPHVLVMTATPIPRTLAMTVYGDLDVSVIDELPPGRKPITTRHQYNERRDELYLFIIDEVSKGRQVYVVYPLIEEGKSKKLNLRNVEEGYEQLTEAFPAYRISKVHGRLSQKEKDAEMARFVSGETQILVATTVIEVGVNVPNASVMIIENAERFGLAQLHQLRGRVGRGAEQSYCILMTGYKIAAETRKRLDIMVKTTDGFEIAEADMLLRGHGDLEGTQQSGMAIDLKIASIARDGQLLGYVRDIARAIVEGDPEANNPDNHILWQRLTDLRNSRTNWAAIS